MAWPTGYQPFGPNRAPLLTGLSSIDEKTPIPVAVDPATGALITEGGGSGGGGTQYTQGGTVPASPTGNALVFGNGSTWQYVNSTNPLPVTGGGGGTQYAEGVTTAPGTGTLALGRYDAASPTLTDGQMNGVQLDASGNLWTHDIGIPALGQGAGGASLPVVIASDQSPIQTIGNVQPSEAGGSISAVNTNLTGSPADTNSAVEMDFANNANAVNFSITGTYSATLVVYGSADGSNWAPLPYIFNFTTATTVTSITGGATGTFQVAAGGFESIRVQASAYTSGTANILMYGVDATPVGTMVLNSGGLVIPMYDNIAVAYPDGVTEVYTYIAGGSGGTTVATVTMVYTDSTKASISTITRT